MNIPNIPSDNLYKFIALSSLVTLILLVYFTYQIRFEISNEEIKYISELKNTYLKQEELVKRLKNKHELNQELISKLEKLNKDLRSGKVKNNQLNDQIEILKDKISTLGESIDVNQKEMDLLKIQNETTNSLLKNKRILKNIIDEVFTYSSGILLILMLLGFYLWYVRVQKYQDKILKIQAKEIEKEKTD